MELPLLVSATSNAERVSSSFVEATDGVEHGALVGFASYHGMAGDAVQWAYFVCLAALSLLTHAMGAPLKWSQNGLRYVFLGTYEPAPRTFSYCRHTEQAAQRATKVVSRRISGSNQPAFWC